MKDTIWQETGPLEDLMTTVKKRKLKWYRNANNLSTVTPTRYHFRQMKKRKIVEKHLLTMSLNVLKDPLQRLGHMTQDIWQELIRCSVVQWPYEHTHSRDWWQCLFVAEILSLFHFFFFLDKILSTISNFEYLFNLNLT